MASNTPPSPPALPKYIIEPIENQSPERLDRIAKYAHELAHYKRQQQDEDFKTQRDREAIGQNEEDDLKDCELSVDTNDYPGVPSNAYITVKETKLGYLYYYWQWREGDSWQNEYIAPVNPRYDRE